MARHRKIPKHKLITNRSQGVHELSPRKWLIRVPKTVRCGRGFAIRIVSLKICTTERKGLEIYEEYMASFKEPTH